MDLDTVFKTALVQHVEPLLHSARDPVQSWPLRRVCMFSLWLQGCSWHLPLWYGSQGCNGSRAICPAAVCTLIQFPLKDVWRMDVWIKKQLPHKNHTPTISFPQATPQPAHLDHCFTGQYSAVSGMGHLAQDCSVLPSPLPAASSIISEQPSTNSTCSNRPGKGS